MKLATYEYQGKESWGYVLPNPFDEGKEYIFNPTKAEDLMRQSGRIISAAVNRSLPKGVGAQKWPESLTEMLALGPDAMDDLKDLCVATDNFLNKNYDRFAIQFAGIPVEKVKLRAPIPRPRLLMGVVGNCGSFWRNQMQVKANTYLPLMHQRPMSSVVAHHEDIMSAGGNVELAFVIGKKGKNIPIEEAYNYIAGYMVAIDTEGEFYHQGHDVDKKLEWGWFDYGTTSFLGKKNDGMCALGPYLVTPDEVGSHYDLLTWTGHNGIMRDRAHTCGFTLGLERIIHWYSSFATVYPGDVFHMGTAGTDGVFVNDEMYTPGMKMQSRIENIGQLEVGVYRHWQMSEKDWAAVKSPAAEDLRKAGQGEIAKPEDWNVDMVRNAWLCIANNKNCQETFNIAPHDRPRVFNAPESCVGYNGGEITVAARATSLQISVQLGWMLKKLARGLKGAAIKKDILGYTPMIAVADNSLWDEHFTDYKAPANGDLAKIYACWGDGYNVVGDPQPVKTTKGLKMRLTVEGFGSVECSTDDYCCNPETVMEYLSQGITMFPGDVVALGRPTKVIEIPAGADIDGKKVTAEIEGMGTVTATLRREQL